MELSNDQLEAVENAKAWFKAGDKNKNPFILTGAAGTGKSSIVSYILEALGVNLHNLLMVASSGTATDNIQRKNPLVRARTIASFLKSQAEVVVITQKGSDDVLSKWSTASDIEMSEEMRNKIDTTSLATIVRTESRDGSGKLSEVPMNVINKFLLKSGYTATRVNDFNITGAKLDETTKLIIIDELGMCSDEELDAMIKTELPIIAMGDPAQLPPIGTKLNKYIKNTDYKYYSELTEVHRQDTGSALLEVATLARTGQDWYSFAKQAQSMGYTDVFVAPKARRNVSQLRYADMILASTNKTVKMINNLLHLDTVAHTDDKLSDNSIAVGDKLVVSANSHEKNDADVSMFTNGQTAVVTKIYDDPNDVLMEQRLALVDLESFGVVLKRVMVNTLFIADPKINAFNMKDMSDEGMNLYRHRHNKEEIEKLQDEYDTFIGEVIYVTYGYAMTVHRAQGKEWNYVMFDPYIPRMMSNTQNEISYTAITRAKKGLVIF